MNCFLSVAELMVLGFISLLLTFGQSYILKICIPSHVAHTMLPCPAPAPLKKEEDDNSESHRRLLWFDHRFLSGGEASTTKCKKEVRVKFFIQSRICLVDPKIVKNDTMRVNVNDGTGL